MVLLLNKSIISFLTLLEGVVVDGIFSWKPIAPSVGSVVPGTAALDFGLAQ